MKARKNKSLLLGRLLLLSLPLCSGGILTTARTASAQGSTQTAINDVVRSADGTPAQGTLLISWSAFTAANGTAVQTGSTSVALGAGGTLNVSLVPNVGSTPLGSFYTVVYHLAGGAVTREYWQVPVSASAVTLQTVRTTVLPTSVAVQTVSKQYVDQAIARAALGGGTSAGGTGDYVLKSGDTMTGALTLPGDPVSPLQAADKNYVDTNTAAVQAGLDQKVSKVPTATQAVTQPSGTQLRANRLNGELHAQQFISQTGNDGIANALAAPECTGSCTVVLDPDYVGNDTTVPKQTGAHLHDERNGKTVDTYSSPAGGGQDVAQTITARFTEPSPASDLFGIGQRINHTGLTGGNNLYPENYGFSLPYFKSTYSATDTVYRQHAMGQHVMNSHEVDCFGVGDCIFDSYYMRASGGFRDAADEGSHPADLQLTEDERVFQGVCSSGCTTGSQVLQVTATLAAGTQGAGRFLIDKAAAKTISTGQLVGGNQGAFPAATAQFTGTSFGASTFFFTAAAIPPQSNAMAPGTVTVGIQTSGVPAGFSTNTSASPSGSGVACIADSITGGTATPQNYEMAPYTVVDGTRLRLTLNKPHGPAAIVAIGGLCGYGLEQTVDTTAGIRQVFPVIGTVNATNLYVASGLTSIVGRNQSTSNYLNLSYAVTAVARSGGVVTVTTASPSPLDTTGTTMALSGVADSSFNGNFPVTLTAGNQFQFAQSGPDASSTGGTLQVLTGGYVLYPMAEVLDVYDATTGGVTGKMTLAPNNVQWAANDPVEQPHYFQEKVSADVEYITQYTPRPFAAQQAGLYYQGNNGPGLTGFVVANTASGYLGSGGTRQAPDTALQTQGTWTTALDMQAGEQTAIRLRCNSRGCGRFNSTYNLFQLDFVPGGSSYDKVTYAPQSGTMQWTLHGTQYTMSPTAMTVGTLNVTNLNATRINGGSGGGTVGQATSTSQGIVQLGPQATSSVLANIATSGLASDLGGTLAAAQTPAMTGDIMKAAGSGTAFVTGASNGLFKSGSSGLADYPANGQASQEPSLWTSYAFTDSNVKVQGHAFAHGIADNNIFNRSAGNCDTLGAFSGGNFAGCAYSSYDARTSYQGANNYNHYVAYQAAGELSANYTGTTDQWYGFLSAPKINGGTANHVFGLRAAPPSGNGTVRNSYGLYVDSQTKGTQNNYGLYVEQNTNVLNGPTNFNNTADGQQGIWVRNTGNSNRAWAGIQVETDDAAHRFVFGNMGSHWDPCCNILRANQVYMASGTGLVNGITYNTETDAPQRWAINSTDRAMLDATRFTLMSGMTYNAPLSTPASSSDTCTAGDFKNDANFHYVCVGANHWRRAALADF